MKAALQLARTTYRRVAGRGRRTDRALTRRYYRQFVEPGDLAFDVGACDGRVAEALLDIGAKVVAIEPDPEVAATLRRRYGRRLEVVEAAVGKQSGRATLHIGRRAIHSTLSEEWMRRAPASITWVSTATVRVTTLSALRSEYGEADFLKIDVEGFEDSVLAGLDWPVRRVTFEYQGRMLDVLRSCLDRLSELGTYSYSFAHLEDQELSIDWCDAEDLWRHLLELGLREPGERGDVVAALAADDGGPESALVIPLEGERRRRRAASIAAAAAAAVFLFVALPEMLGDRPYDPKPTAWLHAVGSSEP